MYAKCFVHVILLDSTIDNVSPKRWYLPSLQVHTESQPRRTPSSRQEEPRISQSVHLLGRVFVSLFWDCNEVNVTQ
jgi:hypothetical protein